ncbi:ALK and LTK ligand 2 isoform X2 [Alligator mississippiensis]|uniref:ALK and LTK ligand 2 isoform X2 n=1 Tax=Alligator mississippiensis TaxID=8496 RepID=UPI00090751C0|nr:ALK and LTK ligand 2 isoform X2 [Alligator mississippiensis]
MGAPRAARLLALLGLLVLSAGSRAETSDSMDVKDRQSLLDLIMEIIQELKSYQLQGESGQQRFPKHDYGLDRREVEDYGGYPDEQRVGPLYFSPKCSKHFHRLYHNTRDCTIPAYYKRCARLLTRLAVSPMCMEG